MTPKAIMGAASPFKKNPDEGPIRVKAGQKAIVVTFRQYKTSRILLIM